MQKSSIFRALAVNIGKKLRALISYSIVIGIVTVLLDTTKTEAAIASFICIKMNYIVGQSRAVGIPSEVSVVRKRDKNILVHRQIRN